MSIEKLLQKINEADKVLVYYKPPYETKYAVVQYTCRKGQPLKVAGYYTYGEEHSCTPVDVGILGMGRFKHPEIYPLRTLDDCIRITENFGWDQEGFVVCDEHFNRVKIKSPAYVMAHYARNNNVITRKHLLEVILSGETEEFLCYASDYKEELEKLQGLMKSFCKVGDQIAKSCQRLYDVPRGTYANWVKTLPKIYQDLAFRNYNDVKSTKDYTAGWSANKWDEYLESFEKLKEDLFNV